MNRPKFELYKAKDGWRWRLLSRNGKSIAESGEAYSRKPNIHKMWETCRNALLEATVEP